MTDQTVKVVTLSNVLSQNAQNGTFDINLVNTKLIVNNTASFLFYVSNVYFNN